MKTTAHRNIWKNPEAYFSDSTKATWIYTSGENVAKRKSQGVENLRAEGLVKPLNFGIKRLNIEIKPLDIEIKPLNFGVKPTN